MMIMNEYQRELAPLVLKEAKKMRSKCISNTCKECEYKIEHKNLKLISCLFSRFKIFNINSPKIENIINFCMITYCDRCPLFNNESRRCLLKGKAPSNWPIKEIKRRLEL